MARLNLCGRKYEFYRTGASDVVSARVGYSEPNVWRVTIDLTAWIEDRAIPLKPKTLEDNQGHTSEVLTRIVESIFHKDVNLNDLLDAYHMGKGFDIKIKY